MRRGTRTRTNSVRSAEGCGPSRDDVTTRGRATAVPPGTLRAAATKPQPRASERSAPGARAAAYRYVSHGPARSHATTAVVHGGCACVAPRRILARWRVLVTTLSFAPALARATAGRLERQASCSGAALDVRSSCSRAEESKTQSRPLALRALSITPRLLSVHVHDLREGAVPHGGRRQRRLHEPLQRRAFRVVREQKRCGERRDRRAGVRNGVLRRAARQACRSRCLLQPGRG